MVINNSREKILATAAKFFHKNGVNATGISQILEESGASRGSFYHYFPGGKDELAEEAVRRTCENQIRVTKEAIDKYPDPIKAFQNRIQYIIDELTRMKGQSETSIALVALESWEINSKLAEICRETFERFIEIYAEKLMENGFDRAMAIRVGLVFQTMIDGGLVLSVTMKNTAALEEIRRQIEVIIKQYM